MTTLVTTVTEPLRYRGAIGQWSWVLHRLSGLGVVLFLTLHVIDTSWAVFYPALYVEAIAAYQSTLFTIGEFALVAAVVYHALNGLRIIIMDARPALWKYQGQAAQLVLVFTVVLLLPTFLIMFGHVLAFYNEGRPVLPIIDSLLIQLPFVAGIGLAIIAAFVLSALWNAVAGDAQIGGVQFGRRIERIWWSFMRLSGILIVPLVFGHLIMIHLIQGVFELTVQGAPVVGTTLVNQSGTAVEFVAHRWNFLVGGVAVWRLYDIALLALVVTHGFNGLRYVLTDYTMDRPLFRRAMTLLTIMGGVVLLVVGAAALLGSIDQSAIDIARDAMVHLYGE
ncbi:MAG: succinate dehydrogenase, cytochrome b556 subunit [Chloroflexi bacterium]|nr:succinate dehydrogenase, cytochrome b556 subunit [Chloroflexota bacterium]